MKTKNKKLTALLCCAVLVLTLAGCASEKPEDEAKKAEEAVTGLITAVQKVNVEEAKKYAVLDAETEAGLDDEQTTLFGALFGKLQYKILSTEAAGDDAYLVKTEITAINIKPLLSSYIEESLKAALSEGFNTNKSEEEIIQIAEQKFTEILNRDNLETITNTVDIRVIKDNNVWKVQADEILANALSGGMVDAAKDLQGAFGSGE